MRLVKMSNASLMQRFKSIHKKTDKNPLRYIDTLTWGGVVFLLELESQVNIKIGI